ncbi:hypothetical protein F4814DRAFT_414002 [Daldinia grandis]|nr:hypothetical protein F4814DRAFT_414002 [Daldinia grandis]
MLLLLFIYPCLYLGMYLTINTPKSPIRCKIRMLEIVLRIMPPGARYIRFVILRPGLPLARSLALSLSLLPIKHVVLAPREHTVSR